VCRRTAGVQLALSVTVRGPTCVALELGLSADRNKRLHLEDQQHMPRGEGAALNVVDTKLFVAVDGKAGG